MPEKTDEHHALHAELETIAAREKALESEEREFEVETAALVKRIEEFEARAQSIRNHEEQIVVQRKQFEEELLKGSDLSSPALDKIVYTKKQALMAFEEQLGERERSLRREEAELYRRRHAIVKKPVGLSQAKKRLRVGLERLDDILMGGIPERTNLLLNAPPLLGQDLELLAAHFILEGVKNGVPGMFVLFDKPAAAVRSVLENLSPESAEPEENGLLKFIDRSTVASEQSVSDGEDWSSIVLGMIKNALQTYRHETEIRIVVDSLSDSDSTAVETNTMQFLRDLRSVLYNYNYATLFLFTALKYAPSKIQSLRHFMDCEIKFKVDNDKTAIMVKGLESRQPFCWVDYKQTSGTFEIGNGE